MSRRGSGQPVNIAPRYLGRGSWLARRDPRVLILVVAFFIFTVLQVWDGRLVLLLLALAVAWYRAGSIPWAQIRRNWTVVFVFIGFLVVVQHDLRGRPGPGDAGRRRLTSCSTCPSSGRPSRRSRSASR